MSTGRKILISGGMAIATLFIGSMALAQAANEKADASSSASGQQSAVPETGHESKKSVQNQTECVTPNWIKNTKILDDQTILFYMKNGKVWKNNLTSSCPRLKREGTFTYKIPVNSLCRGDIITVLYHNGGSVTNLQPGASCALGSFEAYTPPPPLKKPS